MINPEIDFPEEINPSCILAKAYCEFLNLDTKVENSNPVERFFKSINLDAIELFFEKLLENLQQPPTVDLLTKQLSEDKFMHREVTNLKKLAEYLMKNYQQQMTQSYKGYIFPCDVMIRFAVVQIENNYSGRGLVNIRNFANVYYWEAALLYCAVRNYQIGVEIPEFVPKSKYSASGKFFWKKNPVATFKRLLQERALASYTHKLGLKHLTSSKKGSFR